MENSVRLADEMMGKGLFQGAKTLYQNAMAGIYEADPGLMVGLAKSEFGLMHYAEAKTILYVLIEKNSDYKSPEAHLLYARTTESMGEIKLALNEYDVLDGYFPGPEASISLCYVAKESR